MNNQQYNFETISELLPWYANGSLTPAETSMVEQALLIDDELKQQLADLQQLNTHIHAEALVIPDAAKSLSKLKARIQAESTQETPVKPVFSMTHWLQEITQKLAWIPAPVHAFAAIATVAALSFFIIHEQQPSNTFIALSDPAISTDYTPENSITVVFISETDLDASKQLAEKVGASAISGPNTVGAYEIHFDSTATRDLALLELRENPALQLIEPIQKTDS